MSFFELAKRITKKQVDNISNTPDTALKLPMGMDFGKVMNISPVVFALVDDSLVSAPDSRQNIITSISSLKDMSGTRLAFRAYVSNGDANQEQYLQVTANPNDFEAIWFTTLHRHYPQTMEELEAFQGKGFGSGDTTFTLARELLESVGIEQKILDKVYKNEDNLVYSREFEGDDYVAPIKSVETRMDSADQTKGMEQKNNFMLYSRMLDNKEKEFLWISLEAETTRNGQISNEVHVDFMVGLAVNKNRISII